MKMLKMKLGLFVLIAISTTVQAGVNIIPYPQQVKYGNGSFELTSNIAVITNQCLANEANYLKEILEKSFGSKTTIQKRGNGIKLQLRPSLKSKLGDEGYCLKVKSKSIVIEGATKAGVFYGIQSLRQLLPPGFEFNPDAGKVAKLPVLSIVDQPRFSWRAFMLDESRHFKGMEVVKDLLDQMALLKMNVFHWHLTDDQGWRIEIKKYPKLTSVGGYRKDTQTARRSEKRTGVPHQGFYTQEQIKEIIAYASDRHIRIVPEIEMPGHAMAAIAAYPWLGTLGTTTEVPVIFRKMDDSFNISKPKVIRFLKDVLTEVFEIFPGDIVHIGGDEVTLETWEKSPSMKTFMEEKGLSSAADLQVYFTNLISQFVDSTGHRMMGWNEILGQNVHEWQSDDMQVNQTLAKSAVVHFWKGNLELVNKAVTQGYDVVNSHHWETYLDYTYKRIPVSKAYSFDPIPEGLNPEYSSKILGSGCQMWSEWIPTVERMQYQVFPRLAAYAEVGWTEKDNKDFDRFQKSMESIKERWDLLGINFADID